MSDQPLTYKAAGVDVDKGNQLVDTIKSLASRTQKKGSLSHIGGFGALFEIPMDRYQHPVLVSGTDGVGTKLTLAMQLNQHDTIGIDLVTMCVNDILCLGAEPLYFLDYFATGQLDLEQASAVLKGITEGCARADTALIGGETAEMPGLYQGNDYDLAGFCVGVVEKDQIIDGSQVQVGDALIAIASSGAHSNGYSLIRYIIDQKKLDLNELLGKSTLGNLLMEPTRIYTNAIMNLLKTHSIHALAHITGGGLTENIPRVLPKKTQAIIDMNSWQPPALFQWLQQHGNLSDEEMRRTFNIGVGMVICVAETDQDSVLANLANSGETAWQIGHISHIDLNDESNSDTPKIKFING